MEKISNNTLVEGLVNHPYESNPEYFSKINFFYMSPDNKLMTYYWEAPRGSFSANFIQFEEVMYVLEGALEIVSASSTEILEVNDCLKISKGDGLITFNILEHVKAVGHVYPVDEAEYANIMKLMGQKS